MVYYFGSMDSLEPSFPFNLQGFPGGLMPIGTIITCLLYTSDAADE